MSYRVESVVPLTFEDGKVLLPLQGQVIDLMKLDTVAEFRTVLQGIATQTVAAMLKGEQSAASPSVPLANPQVPDFADTAAKIREEFHKQAQDSAERLKEIADTYADSAKKL